LVLSFGKPREEDVVSLIAAKKYGRAIEILKAQLRKRGASNTVRKQLADVLVMAGKTTEAIALLLPLADEFARDGFAAKAVSVLKKIQKLDPSRRDVEERLARLIEEKQREAVVLPLSRPGAIDMEEIGAEAAPDPAIADAGPVLEIGFAMAPLSTPADAGASPPAASEPAAPPPSPQPPARPSPAVGSPDATLPVASPGAPPPARTAGSTPRVPAQPLPALEEIGSPPSLGVAAEGATAEEGVEDYDLLYAADGEEEEDEVLPIEVEPETDSAEPMSDGQFADELMSLVDSAFQDSGAGATTPAAAAPTAGASTGHQIVVSPLFRDFSVDEMVAVIQGLKLLTFDRGDVIIREGQPGGSLYTLTAGRVRAFKKDPATGSQNPLADLKEGAFFGEMSILSGQPRMASIVALTRCELLELDRPTLDGITGAHPHVWDVLREFAEKRAAAARG
jgi:hypothetical protein